MTNIYVLSDVKDKQEDINYLSVFDINTIKSNIDLSIYDALIFTSKNAISSIDEFNQQYKNIPSYTIAPKTAKVLEQYNGNLKYIGTSSNGNDFANEISKSIRNKKILYIRAKKVVSNLVDILKTNNVLCDELVVYETVCKKYKQSKQLEQNSKIIFTSPSSIKCFLCNFTWDKSYIAICIGETTASYLPKNIKYKISKDISINECIALARTI